MGFYFQLNRAPDGGRYLETELPFGFWVLYAIAGFALACMSLAANTVMADLVRIGGTFDKLLISSLFLALPVYLLIGLRLWRIRKEIRFMPQAIVIRYGLGNFTLYSSSIAKSEIRQVTLTNERPSPNVAPRAHSDRQYHIQGHWRVGLELVSGKTIILDRHTEKEAVEGLRQDLERWFA